MIPKIFPAVYSTLSPDAIAVLIAEKYGFDDVKCSFIVRGVGDTYLIESSQGKFVFRAYRSSHRNFSQIKAETELLLALKRNNVSVSYPIEDLSGDGIQTINAIEGERHAVLFSYAQGKSISLLNEKQLQNLGAEVAKFHNVSCAIELSDPRWKFDVETTLYKPLKMLEPAFAENSDDYNWLKQAAKKVEDKLSQINTAEFSKGFCHFDFLPKNFHFDGDAITFFDFDFFGYGWLINDIMTFWQHLSLDVHFGKMTQQDADAAYNVFIVAYGKIRFVSGEELAAVPYLSLGFWLFYMGFHTTHDQFYPFVQPAHLKLRIGLVRQLMEKYWK